MTASMQVTSLGGAALLEELRVHAPNRVKRGTRRALKASAAEFTKAFQANVPAPQTKGHSNVSIAAGMGDRVKADKDALYQAKSGFGVGKKRGTYRPAGIFLLTGTTNRWTGSKTRKTRIYERRGDGPWVSRRAMGKVTQTGNARKFRGRVQKSNIVPRGIATAGPVAKQKFIDVLSRAIRRAQSL